MKYIGIDYSLIEGRPEFWIYFSTNPVPVEYTHKIAAYRINKGFLRILYTPKNYELLIRNTPPEISRQLRKGQSLGETRTALLREQAEEGLEIRL